MKIHHIGYFVKNIEKSKKKYEELGFRVSPKAGNQDIQYDYERNIKILFMDNGTDDLLIELIELLDSTKPSPVDFIIKGGAGGYSDSIPYHICYEVDDIDESIAELRKKHFILINEKAPTTEVLYHKNVCFLYNKAAGMIELIEK
ncbi:MAG: VOC family protein [Lachnospiraceae bacterium]|nr:VOC family protein [Lachnospiraceae bacterium]